MPPLSADLRSASLWNAATGLLGAQFSTLFAVAAPFTLLVSVLVALYGPAPPTDFKDYTPATIIWLLLLPGLVSAIAQLAVCRLVVRPDQPPRLALGAALAIFPAYVVALLLSSLVSGLGFLALVLPGLYLTARLLPLAAVAAVEGGSPGAMLRRCWAITTGQVWPLAWLMLLALLFVFGTAALAGIAVVAIKGTLKLIGFGAVVPFAEALINGGVGTVLAIAFATATAIIYQRLAAVVPDTGRP